jgi:PIN domain nuclease of toxin-antitoxin system
MNRAGKLILDTHIWIWLIGGDSSLGEAMLAKIETAAESGRALIPAISIWEVAMLERKGRIVLTEPALQWARNGLAAPGLALAPLTPEIAVVACNLPDPTDIDAALKDPADCMIVATARIEDATLVTRDRRLIAYGQAGHVAVLAA